MQVIHACNKNTCAHTCNSLRIYTHVNTCMFIYYIVHAPFFSKNVFTCIIIVGCDVNLNLLCAREFFPFSHTIQSYNY